MAQRFTVNSDRTSSSLCVRVEKERAGAAEEKASEIPGERCPGMALRERKREHGLEVQVRSQVEQTVPLDPKACREAKIGRGDRVQARQFSEQESAACSRGGHDLRQQSAGRQSNDVDPTDK